MPQPIRFGVLGAARIALNKVIPAMQRSEQTPIAAIASRDAAKAEKAARALGIARSYGSYEELIADPEIDAIYNPLPNHLHVPWSIRAAEAGKHVLCEKPLGLSTDEVKQLIEARDRTGVKIAEAFMVHTHPQWVAVKEWIEAGRIGRVVAASGYFSYFLTDPLNIRNVAAWGGGGLMDVGCYPIHCTRFVLGAEPSRVLGLFDFDEQMKVDRVATGLLDYDGVQVSFTCSTQCVPYQRMQFYGTTGRIEIEIPFNAPPDRPCRVFVDEGGDLFGRSVRTEEFAVCDQYTIQGERFAEAVRGEAPVAVPLENALANMAVIEAMFRSAKSGRWETPTT